jgi:hypothetical protein
VFDKEEAMRRWRKKDYFMISQGVLSHQVFFFVAEGGSYDYFERSKGGKRVPGYPVAE